MAGSGGSVTSVSEVVLIGAVLDESLGVLSAGSCDGGVGSGVGGGDVSGGLSCCGWRVYC